MKRTGIHGAGMVSIGDMANGAVGGVVAPIFPWWDPNEVGLCVWSAYQAKGAANLTASYTDLTGNGNNTGPGVAPAWDAVNGWKFNGTTQYLTTTFVPQNDQTQSILVQFSNRTNTGMLCGMTTIAGAKLYLYLDAGDNIVGYANGDSRNTAPVAAAGNLAIAGNWGYRNGVLDTFVILAYASVPTHTVYIGARNNIGVMNLPVAAYIQALAIYDCALTGPQVLAIYNAMAAL